MKSKFLRPAQYEPEPLLGFGYGGKHEDPKAGLALYGPCGHPDETTTSPSSIRIGIVGTSASIEEASSWLTDLNDPVLNDKDNPRLFPPFPGFRHALRCDLVVSDSLVYHISPGRLDRVLAISSLKRRVVNCADLFSEGLSVLSEKTGRPNVVVYAWPEAVVEKCTSLSTRGRGRLGPEERKLRATLVRQEELHQTRLFPLDPDTEDLMESGAGIWNLRSEMKAQAMSIGAPIQILLPRTYQGQSQLEDPTTPWNLCVALYFKAGGYPWRPIESDPDVCYVGISFYRDKTVRGSRMKTSLAQIFSDLGHGLVLRGSKFRWDTSRGHSPHMDRETSEDLLSGAVKLYRKHVKRTPRRVVVHKSSPFWDEELAGLESALQEVEEYDLLDIRRSGIQFVRHGAQPPLRGTTIRLDKDRHLLYTLGYIPFIQAYPGVRIPQPLTVTQAAGHSGPRRVMREILTLSKMNLNTARFCCREPATLMYARFVKEVLSQVPEEALISEDYSSYM